MCKQKIGKVTAKLLLITLVCSMVFSGIPQVTASRSIGKVITRGTYDESKFIKEYTVEPSAGHIKMYSEWDDGWECPRLYSATEFLDVTPETRSQYAVRLKIYDAQIAFQAYSRPALIGSVDGINGTIIIPYKEFIPFVKESGKDYQELTLLLSNFSDQGVVLEAAIEDANIVRSADPEWKWYGNFKLVDADYSKIHLGIGAKKLGGGACPQLGLQEGASGIQQGYMVIDDVEFIKIEDISVEINGVDRAGKVISTVEDGIMNIPANAIIAVTFNSDFTADLEDYITLETADGTVVEATVIENRILERTYNIIPVHSLTEGENYVVKIAAGMTDIMGKTFAGEDFVFKAIAEIETLNEVTNLRTSSVSKDSIVLAWDPPLDDEGQPDEVDKYLVYRNDVFLAETIENTYVDTDVVPNSTYRYYIVAVKGQLTSVSEEKEFNSDIFEGPENMALIVASHGIVKFEWDAVDGVLGYNIYRNGTRINQSLITTEFYTDNNLAPGIYTYDITAVAQNPSGTQYESLKTTLSTTLEGSVQPIRTVFAGGKLGNSVYIDKWSTWEGAGDTVSVCSEDAITGKAIEITTKDWGGIKLLLSNAADISVDKTDGGVFFYLKVPSATATGLTSFRISGNINPDYNNIQYTPTVTDGYIPVYIPVSETPLKDDISTFNGLIVASLSNTKSVVRLDNVMFVTRTPKVMNVFMRDQSGNIITDTTDVPSKIASINIKFNTPMEASTLANIKLIEGNADVSYTGTYDPETLVYSIAPDRNLSYQGNYRIVVPTSVRAMDTYGTFEDYDDTTRIMTTDVLNQGPAITEEYTMAFTTEENPLAIALSIEKEDGTSNVNAKAIVSNTSGTDQEVTVIICTYETVGSSVKLTGIKIHNQIVLNGANGVEISTESLVVSSGTIVKAFVWDNLDDMNILTDVLEEVQ